MKNILLIQFRRDSSAIHERDCFLRYFKKRKNLKLKIIDIFDKKINFSSPQKLLKNSCGVILGGSGEFYLSKNEGEKEKIVQEMLKRVTPLIRYLLQNDFPTIGVCFGHQILGYFLGEKVIIDKKQAGTGTFLVSLTKNSKKSSLFFDIIPKFFAQFGHRDSLENLPKNTQLLAKTKKCKVAAFKYKDNIYGIQFHPELNCRDMIFRIKFSPEYITTGTFEKIKKTLKPTPHAFKIIKNFLDKVCSY